MAFSDRELLARLIQCEAGGEGDAGMRGVAGVIMNRVNAPGGNICASVRAASGILFFSPVSLPVCRNLWGDGQICKTSTICARRLSIMKSRIGRSRANGCIT